MLDTTQLLAAGGFAAWPDPDYPMHVSTPFGVGQVVYVLRGVVGVRLVGQFEVNEFQIAACKVLPFDGGAL